MHVLLGLNVLSQNVNIKQYKIFFGNLNITLSWKEITRIQHNTVNLSTTDIIN